MVTLRPRLVKKVVTYHYDDISEESEESTDSNDSNWEPNEMKFGDSSDDSDESMIDTTIDDSTSYVSSLQSATLDCEMTDLETDDDRIAEVPEEAKSDAADHKAEE
jgi:hypothetical protein